MKLSQLACGVKKVFSRLVIMRGGILASRDTLAPEGTHACGKLGRLL